jgi:hypothetical protein
MLPSAADTISSFISTTNFNIIPHVRLYLLLRYFQLCSHPHFSYFILHDRRPFHPIRLHESNNIMQRIQIETPRIIIGFILLISLPFSFVCYYSLVVERDSQRRTARSNGTNVQLSANT